MGRDAGPAPGSTERRRRPGSWRLTGTPSPAHSERLGRIVGLRVLRVPGIRRALVLAGSVDRLRDLAAAPAGLIPLRSALIVVAWWRPSRRGWCGVVDPLPGMLGHRVSRPRLPRGPATAKVRLARPTALREIVRAVLPAFGPGRPLPGPASAAWTAQDVLPAYLPAEPGSSVILGELPDSPDIRAHDVVLSAADQRLAADDDRPRSAAGGAGTHGDGGTGDVDSRYAVGFRAGRHALVLPRPAVLVDARRINPRGRRAAAYRPDNSPARLEFDPTGRAPRLARLVGAGPVRGSLDGPGLDAAALATLRGVGVVEVPAVPRTDPAGVAALLVQVAMTGAVLAVPELPAQVADLIAPELRELFALAPPVGGGLALEARSVRQRRAALRGHGTAFALPRATAGTFPELARPPTVSAVLATRRPEMLASAVGAILAQTYPELELVLCLHGIELPAGVRATLAAADRPVEIVRVPATASFGVALGAATRRCRGTLVTKFDDDDSYATEHVWDLVLARHYSGATLVGKGSEFVHLETLGATVRRPSGVPEADGDLVAGGTMLLAKGDLEAVGGWRPVPRSVDHGVIDRLRRAGAVIFRTHPLGYIYHRRESGHTWDPGQQYFLETAYARWPGIPPDAYGEPWPPPVGPAAPDGPDGSAVGGLPAVVGPGPVA
ncbi:glycosyltransferase [Solwaraspora sp. WMMD1047]|uniref:glycosyltransferase family 2 protein n=1 Tax=Solwaraspora sp. WMMD1047 TaxID=3016102 RepID=UPI0024165434|nr:glycosyltransferase [Solwaraspora sp. WMMD1047]MDG4831301.1 glycosyltransferase [Solwaraspora sp. WMMD1047]